MASSRWNAHLAADTGATTAGRPDTMAAPRAFARSTRSFDRWRLPVALEHRGHGGRSVWVSAGHASTFNAVRGARWLTDYRLRSLWCSSRSHVPPPLSIAGVARRQPPRSWPGADFATSGASCLSSWRRPHVSVVAEAGGAVRRGARRAAADLAVGEVGVVDQRAAMVERFGGPFGSELARAPMAAGHPSLEESP